MSVRQSTGSGTTRSASSRRSPSRHSSGTENEKPTDEQVHERPWKYIGYKGYAEFISSEDDFYLLRRFDTLNIRATLALQDEISQLEQQLENLDQEMRRVNGSHYNNGTMRGDEADRSALLSEITRKLKNYNEFLIQQTVLRKYPKAPKRDRRSLKNWHFNHDYKAIHHEEQRYLDRDDLVPVAFKEKTPLREVIDSSLRLRTLSIWRHKDNVAPTYDSKEVSYYSDKRMNAFASAMIIAIGVTMLITPIWVLQRMDDLKEKLAVITVFIFVFLLVMSLAMVTKPFEALGATAA
ncbi:hypothetical protein CkaCkLH20_06110 [Colletotrichum karsti]|uniref:DUF6594 domain-containing protein n=1 Tax=Colletotrichum karsti TaxID=1095194 RepID=A0A9P6LL39_9PEZI|nr:uncharacterized protein CkaCkLH20_06110 [Colletotrichum karsti]KAF9876167.1 hypothetical protein CkaCkLH20_06110 [Colletotrichum karsti]